MLLCKLKSLSYLGFFLFVLLVSHGYSHIKPASAAINLRGFVEPAYSVRFDNVGPISDRNMLNETRFIMENQWYGRQGEMLDLRLLGAADFSTGHSSDLELRAASVFVPLTTNLELSLGRQVLDWGPAQFEFVNDYFSKDFTAFFLGRDLEFMKAPSDALRVRWYSALADFDLAVIPEFHSDIGPAGQKIPLVHPDPDTGLVSADQLRAAGIDQTFPVSSPERGEVHLRISRLVSSWETALYGYRGHTGTPAGYDQQAEQFYYPQLAAVGGSIRGPLLGGIFWSEVNYEDIREPLAGDTVGLPPDQFNLLVGYQFDPSPERRYLLQAHWLRQLSADGLRAALVDQPDHPLAERDRYRVQFAAEQSFLADRLTLAARFFWGIQVEDWHLRLEADYQWSDAVRFYLGTLFYDAENPASRFGPLQDHDLIYTRLRYSF